MVLGGFYHLFDTKSNFPEAVYYWNHALHSCSFVPASVLLVTYSFKLELIACKLEQTN
jgi:hypothetical protein